MKEKPIENKEMNTNWKSMIINECNEPLVSMKQIKDKNIIISPQYYLQGVEGSIDDVLVRKEVAKKLKKVASNLPSGIKLVLLDGWRPIEVQKYLFLTYKQKFQKKIPAMSDSELVEYTSKYVSYPSINERSPSPHFTGGAIDLTLCNDKGEWFNMGTDFDEMIPESQTDYFEKKEDITDEEREIINNRRLLYHSMISEGFTNYNEEWWHFDYGNQFWGYISNNNAIYGGKTFK